MNKKLLGSMVVAAAIFTGYSAYDAQNKRRLSESVLANVEALANNESGPICATDESYMNICNYYDSAHPCPCGF